MNEREDILSDIDLLEKILKSHPSVREVKVVVSSNENKNKFICAFVLGENNHIRSNQILRNYLIDKLPVEGLIPDDFKWVENIKNIEIEENTFSSNVQDGLTATEGIVSKIWCNILGLNTINKKDVFFDVGGDSLKCVEVLHYINQQFPNVTLVDLFKYTNLEDLSYYIDKTNDNGRINGIDNGTVTF